MHSATEIFPKTFNEFKNNYFKTLKDGQHTTNAYGKLRSYFIKQAKKLDKTSDNEIKTMLDKTRKVTSANYSWMLYLIKKSNKWQEREIYMKKALRVMAKDDIPVSENSQKVNLYCSSKVKLQDNISLKKYWKIDHSYINRKNKVKYSEKQYKK